MTASPLAKPSNGAEGGHQPAQGNDGARDNQAGPVALLIKQPTGPNEAAVGQPQAQTEQSKQYDLRDLIAQEIMAEAAVWMAVAAVGTLLVTAIGTFFLAWQVKLTRKAVEDTSEATEAMREANEIASDTSRRQLRAYVGTSDAMIPSGGTIGTIGISVNLHNDGNTPAYEVRTIYRIQFSADGQDKFRFRFRDAPAPGHSVAIIGPGRSVAISHEKEIGHDLLEAAFSAKGHVTMIFAGIISYRDAFGRRRLTTFRYFLAPGKTPTKAGYKLEVCGVGNNAN